MNKRKKLFHFHGHAGLAGHTPLRHKNISDQNPKVVEFMSFKPEMSHSFCDLRIWIHVLGLRIFLKKLENHHVKAYSSYHESFHTSDSKFVPQITAATRRRGQCLIFNIRGVYLNAPSGELRSALGSAGLCFSYIYPKQRKRALLQLNGRVKCATHKRGRAICTV